MKDLEKSRISEISQLHSEIAGYIKVTLEKAIRIGELLAEQKAGMDHGTWLPWMEGSLPFSRRQAQRYMKLYQYREELGKNDTMSYLVDAYKCIESWEARKRRNDPERIRREQEWEKRKQEVFAEARRKAQKEREEWARDGRSKDPDIDDLLGRADEEINRLANLRRTTADFTLFDPEADGHQSEIFGLVSGYFHKIKDPNRRLQAVHNLIKKLKATAIECQQEISGGNGKADFDWETASMEGVL